MRTGLLSSYCIFFVLYPSIISVQSELATPSIIPNSAVETVLPELTTVEIEILEPLNSKTSKIGEFFGIRLIESIIVGGKIILPAGITGHGEVVHAAKARAAGKAGELIITARYLNFNGSKIPLRSFKYGVTTGKNNSNEALAVGSVAGPLMFFISGGNVDIPAGTRAYAKTAIDLKVPLTGENK